MIGQLTIKQLIQRLKRLRGPYLGDGVNEGFDSLSLLNYLQLLDDSEMEYIW